MVCSACGDDQQMVRTAKYILLSVDRKKGVPMMEQKLKLTANILYAGIGCQERGIENSGVIDLDVRAVSEIDCNAVLSYAAIHKGLTPELIDGYKGYPTEEEMVQDLIRMNIGYDTAGGKAFDWNRLKKDREYTIKKHWLACRLIHNLGDISRIEALPQADMWTASFPCQDISVAGAMRGLKEGSGTRSSLLWESIRLLRKAIEEGTEPKILIFENVKNLVGNKFKGDFLNLLKLLEELGYRPHYKILNAKDCGVPQNRERIFIVCIRKDIDPGSFHFPRPYKSDIRVEDIIDPGAGRAIPINLERLKLIAGELKKDDTYSGAGLDKKETCAGAEKPDTADMKHTYTIGRLSPQMCFQLMGLTKEDVRKCRALGIADRHLCGQAGNGIVTNCIQLIGEHLYKALEEPSFICTDERMNGVRGKDTPETVQGPGRKPA